MPPARKLIALSAVGFVVLNNTIAVLLVFAAYGFDAGLFLADGELATHNLGTAGLMRWGALIDMLGYLCVAPVVVYMYATAPGRGVTERVLALCGLGFVLVGAIGAVLLASAGAWLLESAATGAGGIEAARTAYGALESAVFVGLWGTLELFLLGAWLVGVGRRLVAVSRPFGFAAIVAGVGCLGYSIRSGLTGRPPLPIETAIDIAILACVAFLPIWMLWLALRLARPSVAPVASGLG
jgi:hypothetical protein